MRIKIDEKKRRVMRNSLGLLNLSLRVAIKIFVTNVINIRIPISSPYVEGVSRYE
ncbi:hypothetical protein CWI38_2502p0020 [Hamiltosporidium tvaerminnensis]|uniref:Uncharacterized protein n=1 Tax=Hamiltosporidium tvaerminnensis TaxID=1176355 RepID=A0A4Q9LFK7_9MICR|nr:hypothetical protein CWI38_2502p0020 [Hamiltosporidium tvaerminnensis]